MNCFLFQLCNPLVICTGELTIGQIADTNKDIDLFVKNNTTDFLKRFELTSDASGYVIVNLSSLMEIGAGHEIAFWITDRDSNFPFSASSQIRFNVPGSPYLLSNARCSFSRVYNSDDSRYAPTTQQISL